MAARRMPPEREAWGSHREMKVWTWEMESARRREGVERKPDRVVVDMNFVCELEEAEGWERDWDVGWSRGALIIVVV